MKCTVGVIADTHGLLRPEALAALAGVDRIVHAGDIGASEVLEALARIAPVTAVRGNNDGGPWARGLPDTATLALGTVSIYVLHDVNTLAIDPAAAGHHVVIAGHSHMPRSDEREGVLYFNPGSAGPRRFRLPVTIGKLEIDGPQVRARIEPLELAPAR